MNAGLHTSTMYVEWLNQVVEKCSERYFPMSKNAGSEMFEVGPWEFLDPASQCMTRGGTTLAVALFIDVRLSSDTSGEAKEQSVLLCDLPWLSEQGVFLVDGREYGYQSALSEVAKIVDDHFHRWSRCVHGTLALDDFEDIVPSATLPRLDSPDFGGIEAENDQSEKL